jgi:beta-N-acetylhexosaminidase
MENLPAMAPPTRAQIRRRRAVALLVAALATAAIWAALLRGDSGPGTSENGGAAGASDQVQTLVARMSPAQRVDQILLLGFAGTGQTSPVFAELQDHELGGLVIRAENWVESAQGRQLIAQLRAAGLGGGRISPLIATQQEGGQFRSLEDLPPTASELQIGNRGSPQLTEGWARAAAAALRATGLDLNLFPVADVGSSTSPLAARSFSDDPATAAAMTAAAIRGCRDVGLACAPLHFPGLGAASQDTDVGPATVSLDAGSLADRDLAAFDAAFDARSPAVVLSLAFYAAYDPVTPAALAPDVVTGLLRDQLGYEGAAITDDLGAGAIKATYRIRDAAVAAVAAGADMVQIDSPNDQAGVREALLDAAESGQIPEARLEEAAARVLELKRRLGLLKRSH